MEELLKFVQANLTWIIIGAAVLLALIVIIVIIAVAVKKSKAKKAERNDAPPVAMEETKSYEPAEEKVSEPVAEEPADEPAEEPAPVVAEEPQRPNPRFTRIRFTIFPNARKTADGRLKSKAGLRRLSFSIPKPRRWITVRRSRRIRTRGLCYIKWTGLSVN